MPRKKRSTIVTEADEYASMQAEQPVVVETVSEQAGNARLEALQIELETERSKAEENLDGWRRAVADFANYKKRVERDQVLAQQTATASVVKRYLDIADDLDRALQNRPKEGVGASWAEGIDLIYRKLLALLEAEGVKMVETEGKFFDPNMHEAISHEDSPNHESGQIIGVVQQGYQLGDRVLRPARVRVAR